MAFEERMQERQAGAGNAEGWFEAGPYDQVGQEIFGQGYGHEY